MADKRKSRVWLMLGTAAILLLLVVFAFWPQPVLVDMGAVERGPMKVTIDEEARTRVHDSYVVSAPVDGRLLRVEVEPGDSVLQGSSLLVRMLPVNPPALDYRSREEGKAAVSSAQAAVATAQARLEEAEADITLAEAELGRLKTLHKEGLIAQAALDQGLRNFNAWDGAVRAARAAIIQRKAELASAQAGLISFSTAGDTAQSQDSQLMQIISLRAPVTGRVLQILQKSETIVASGTPILELGDVANDLEIVSELLSTDAVKVTPGARVVIDKWGGTEPLNGVVERLEPWGYTKFSALGVEEQRVNAIIKFSDPLARRAALGHGFRVEVKIVIWEDADALIAPSSTLFREAGQWAVYVIADGQARRQPVKVGHNNGVQAEILDGLSSGQQLVLYPPPSLNDGDRVAARNID